MQPWPSIQHKCIIDYKSTPAIFGASNLFNKYPWMMIWPANNCGCITQSEMRIYRIIIQIGIHPFTESLGCYLHVTKLQESIEEERDRRYLIFKIYRYLLNKDIATYAISYWSYDVGTLTIDGA
jgi:hypothetical protein